MSTPGDEILTPEFLRLLARSYVAVLEGVFNTGVHGLDSEGLEKIRLELGLEKHHFLAVISQLAQGLLLATDDDKRSFATEHTEAFVKLFRNRLKALELKKQPERS